MRNISFSMTTPAFKHRRKTVTRRLGWWSLKPGDVLMGVEKAQGLKKGEKIVKLGAIRIVGTARIPLSCISESDCAQEGFPHATPAQFIKAFIEHNKCDKDMMVNRIEFEYL